jgi:Uma2 family endonuclease
MTRASAISSEVVPLPKKRKVPQYLIRETLDGMPLYYKGYRNVLSRKQQIEDIMAYSSLQALILHFFTFYVLNQLNLKKYYVFTGETGSHLSHRSNLSLDIAVFDRAVLTNDKINNKYADVPPKLVIEVDLKVEWDDHEQMPDVVTLKTQRLIDFGTEKVIWVFSTVQKLLIAETGKDWILCDWNKEVTLIEGITFNLGQYLTDEGINLNSTAQ